MPPQTAPLEGQNSPTTQVSRTATRSTSSWLHRAMMLLPHGRSALRLRPAEGLGAVSTARSPVGGAEAVELEAPLDEARELRPLPPPPPPSPE